MIGKRVESVSRLPTACVTLLALSGLAALCSLVESRTAVAAGTSAILLGLASIIRWLIGERYLSLEFDEDSFVVGPRGQRVCYADIWGLRREPGASHRSSYAIEILTGTGAIYVPHDLTVPSRDVEEFLREQMPRVRMPADQAVRDHVERMIRQFGHDRVWWTNGMPPAKVGSINTRLLLTAAILFAVSIAIVALTASLPQRQAIGAGCGIAMVVAATMALISFFTGSFVEAARMKQSELAAVVVSPLGLAVKLGDLQGEARWDQVKDIRFHDKPAKFAFTAHGANRAIVIKLPGVSLRLGDIFDRSLDQLHERLQGYWR
jgi:hypothetical protein